MANSLLELNKTMTANMELKKKIIKSRLIEHGPSTNYTDTKFQLSRNYVETFCGGYSVMILYCIVFLQPFNGNSEDRRKPTEPTCHQVPLVP